MINLHVCDVTNYACILWNDLLIPLNLDTLNEVETIMSFNSEDPEMFIEYVTECIDVPPAHKNNEQHWDKAALLQKQW